MPGNDVIRANRKYEGQSCAICKKEIFLGDLIHICPNCQSINHEDCWQNEGGCNSLSCNSLSSRSNTSRPNSFSQNIPNNFGNNYQSQGGFAQQGGFPQQSGFPQQNGFSQQSGFPQQGSFSQQGGSSQNSGMSQNMVQCRFCKEPIMRGARKCKHCGQYQRDEDRKQQAILAEDSDLSFNIFEGLAIFCCPFLSILLGAIYTSNGRNEKGMRIIKYSIGWALASTILNFVINIIAAG